MQEQSGNAYQCIRSALKAGAAVGMLALGSGAWAANDLDIAQRGTRSGIDAKNMELVGWNDVQGRVIYQTSIHNQNTVYGKRVIAYAGHFNATMLNPMTGQMEKNGTSIVDVTDPANPVYLKHLPASNGGGRMNRLCDGDVLPKGLKGHVYLLRENGALAHEVWDVTNPESPAFVTTVIGGQTTTHKNYWDCYTGIAYLVAGASATSAAPDGWKVNQHTKVYDLSNPAAPIHIMDHGLPGQNPVTSVPVPPAQLHGAIVVSDLNGDPKKRKNRYYGAYGTESNGVLQVVDLVKMLPPPYGTGKYVDPFKPTDAELLQSQIGRLTAPGVVGGHTSWPIYGVEVAQNRNFTEYTELDILAFTSEETSNRCTSAVHNMTLIDITAEAIGTSSAEQHPWPISTVTVNDYSGRPNFCSRGTRFGVHSTHESFTNDMYGKLVTSAWFNAGIRVTDIRDPYNPREVAYLVYPINANTQPSVSVINGITYSQLDVSCDNTEVDDDSFVYCGDRVGGGLYITRLTGTAAAIIGQSGAAHSHVGTSGLSVREQSRIRSAQ